MAYYQQALPRDLRIELRRYTVKDEIKVKLTGRNYDHHYIDIYFADKIIQIYFHIKILKTFLDFIRNNKNYIDMHNWPLPLTYSDNVINMYNTVLVYSDKKLTLLRITDDRFRNVIRSVRDVTFDELQTEEILNELNKFIDQ